MNIKKHIFRFGFHGTLWFYSGISIVALLYGFYFMPDYSRYHFHLLHILHYPQNNFTPSFFSVSLAGIEKEAAEKLGGETTIF